MLCNLQFWCLSGNSHLSASLLVPVRKELGVELTVFSFLPPLRYDKLYYLPHVGNPLNAITSLHHTGEPYFNAMSSIPHGCILDLASAQNCHIPVIVVVVVVVVSSVSPCLSLGEVFNLIMSSHPLIHLVSLHLFISFSGKIKVHGPFLHSLASILNLLILLSYQRWLFWWWELLSHPCCFSVKDLVGRKLSSYHTRLRGRKATHMV